MADSGPITPGMLRADWQDDRHLDDATKAMLAGLRDDELQAALDTAFAPVAPMWWDILDNTRATATSILVGRLRGTD